FAPVPEALYHAEWERRKLRNKIHLNQSGCLGPCVLANVATLLIDGRSYWFHSINDEAIIYAIYDYIELLLADAEARPPAILEPHRFNGFAWDGQQDSSTPAKPVTMARGEGILVLSQADTDLLTLNQTRALLPDGFVSVQGANVGRLSDDDAVDDLFNRLLTHAQIVVARLHSTRSFAHGLERLQRWAEESAGFLLCLPAVEAFDPDLMARSNVGVPLAQAISVYFQCGGAQNLANGLQCLSDHLLVTGWGFAPPEELPLHGVYEAVDNSAPTAVRCRLPTDHCPTVGLLFYRSHLLSGNTEFVDAILAELTKRGLATRAVYTQSLKECGVDGMPVALDLLRTGDVPAAIISTLSFALGDGGAAFAQLDAPVIQAITASSDHAAWQRNGRGLGPLDTA
ncbi:MAG: cobaltochelatase subunit CobN, partial [Caldilineaceae bacterium]|nr:cobaltochelatase subunit CobN [Caldilineaceae bacterium]